MHKKNPPEILFTRTELLADPANPSHAYCSECEKVKPIKAFTRRVPPLLMQKWGWDKLLDKRRATYTFNTCNYCAKRKRPLNYDRYDATLKATGRHEFVVQLPTGETMTQRELLIKQKRAEGRARKVESGKRIQRNRHKDAYAPLQNKLKSEIAKVKYQRTRMENLTEQAQNYLTHYTEHLASIRENILACKADGRKPRPNPADYINDNALPTRQARQEYNKLGGVEQARVSSVYL